MKILRNFTSGVLLTSIEIDLWSISGWLKSWLECSRENFRHQLCTFSKFLKLEPLMISCLSWYIIQMHTMEFLRFLYLLLRLFLILLRRMWNAESCQNQRASSKVVYQPWQTVMWKPTGKDVFAWLQSAKHLISVLWGMAYSVNMKISPNLKSY